MKFLIIQENGRHPISKHLRECNSLQRALIYQGEECDVWGLGHDNYGIIPNYESYDIIINLENYDIGWVPDLSKITKPIKLLWAIDSHCQGKGYYTNIFLKGKYTKILEATKYYIDQNSVWFPNCYDSDFITPIDDIKKSIFLGFCGNYVNRHQWFDILKSKIPNFKLDINVRGIHMIRAINSYHIHFNKNMSNDINYRNFETLGCKTFLLTDYNEQYSDLGFKNEEHFYTYKNIDDLIEKINFLRNHPEIIEKSALAGFNFVKEKHSFKSRAKDLIKIVSAL